MRLPLESISSVRNPRHTGENRCLPCTVVNLLIAALLATAIGSIATIAAGVVAFTAFVTVIVLRGYLVPGTPTLTREYLPAPVLSLFGKRSTDRSIGTAEIDWDTLAAAGLLENQGAERLRLRADVREQLYLEARRYRRSPPSDEEIAAMVDGDVRRLDDLAVTVDGSRRLRWPSVPALAADVAAADCISELVTDWKTLEAGDRRDLLERVRLLLERCPTCDGAIERTVERDEHCCQRPTTVVTAVCNECRAPIAERVVSDSKSELTENL
ncbi:hypothetical protein [Halostagnicola sp. A-GB9-2]|uniref:hypothetical protein n=1 Tax=Halostagnicola sp. A-GB9-2 TaxID=3048066 RepID=UPI0024C05B52|nr:hypothetical protein [Halostagnicola sp. A-GB9-2]MDJ1434118.1 hypothetical protein [Halostagnicola sp. A-GB9-2]